MNVADAIEAFRGHRTPTFRIVQQRRRWVVLSGTVIAVSLLGLVLRGLNFTIDFSGGTQITLANPAGASVEEVRDLLGSEPYGRETAEILVLGDGTLSIRTSSLTDLTQERRNALTADLAALAGIEPEGVNQQVVGPTWGRQISRQALIGMVLVLIAITIYISLRFEPKMALGAIVAMVHDVAITVGVYALTGRQVAPATIIAVLTILGFSLYDTVVIYDRLKENTQSPSVLVRSTYEEIANDSMNQVLMRSVNTSLVVVLPILSLLLFGGETLRDFAFAMFVGVVTGAYSSIFIAVPLLVVLKEREPKVAEARARLMRGRAAGTAPEREAGGAQEAGERPAARPRRRTTAKQRRRR